MQQPEASVDPPATGKTPWEQHLRDIYDGHADETDGLVFFSTRGYDNDDENSNSVEEFQERVGLDASWFEAATNVETKEEKVIKRITQSAADHASSGLSSASKPSPWETHLRAIYDTPIDEYFYGLAFFATHGYYDSDENEISPVQELLKSIGPEFLWGEFW